MSDIERPKFENKISLGSIFTILAGLAAVGVIVGALQSDMRALSQRLDVSDKKIEYGERRDEKAAEALESVRGAIIDMRAEQRLIKGELERQNRQLDRIEQLLQVTKPPAVPAVTRQ